MIKLSVPQYEYNPDTDGVSYVDKVKDYLMRINSEIKDIESISDILSDRIKYNDKLPDYILNDYSEELSENNVTHYQGILELDPEIAGSILYDISSQLSPVEILIWSTYVLNKQN